MARRGLSVAAAAALAVAAPAAPALASGQLHPTGGGGLSAQRARPGTGWSAVPTPNPRAGNGVLNAVSCPTTAVCTAVGLHVRESGLGVTLAEQRSGGVWAVQPTPNPPGAASSALNAVSCPSGSACTAVGQFAVKSGAQLTLAERWNGSSWRIQPTPHPAPSSSLSAVACPAADACIAVGSSNSKLLAERWGGNRWRIQPAPVPHEAQFSELNGVTCTVAASCVAVGDYVNSSGADVTLAERWNGSNWTIQPTPNPSGAESSALIGVSCTGPGACEAVGGSSAGIVAERWNGTKWSLQTLPAPAGAQFAVLISVSCAAAACEAVGGYANSSGAFVPLGEGWNGAAWHAQPVPNPARASTSYLQGASCPSPSDCTAVGLGNGDGTPFTLGERWRNSGWSPENIPSPIGAAENQLNGIACPATDACVAVGTAGPTRGVESTEALWWNGRSWRLQHIPTFPAGAGLNAVSCTSPSACTAVGGSNSGTLAERWNGTNWTILPAPNPAGAVMSFLIGISCTSASNCIAAGAYFTTSSQSSPALPLTEQWNGHKWAILPTPHPAGSVQTFLGGISCTSPSACTATGEQHSPSGIVHTIAEHWNGTTWTIQPTPNPPGTPFASLASVDCTGPSACTTVGPALTSVGWLILAERWNGTTWTIQPTPLLPAAHNMSPPAVACPALSTCTTVGGYENDGPGSVTLAEQWQGGNAASAPGSSMASAGLGTAFALPLLLRAGIENATRPTPSPWRGLRTATPTGNPAAAPLPLPTGAEPGRNPSAGI
jgi:hypothetical protein